jgi:hypothetical protein
LDLEKAFAQGNGDVARFEKAYQEQLLAIQSFLGDPGYGPVASLATERADMHRMDRVIALAEALDNENKSMQEEMIKLEPSVAKRFERPVN